MLTIANLSTLGYVAYDLIAPKADEDKQRLIEALKLQEEEIAKLRKRIEDRDIMEIQQIANTQQLGDLENQQSNEINQRNWVISNNKELINPHNAPKVSEFGKLFINFYLVGTLACLSDIVSASRMAEIIALSDEPLVLTLKPVPVVNKAVTFASTIDTSKVIFTFEKLTFYIENNMVYREPHV